MYIWGKGRAAGRVGSGQTFCRQPRVGSGRVNVSPGRVGSKKSDPWTTLHHLICPLCWATTNQLDNFVRPAQISWYNHPPKLNLALLHFTPLNLWSGKACQPMSGHHLPFRPSRKCSKLISAAILPRSRASPVPQIHFDWAHPDPVIMNLACVLNRHYYY